ncbi:MAG: hypothetical protein WCT16_05045 [Candidatus Buchananbacteria bacterium]
MTEKQENHGRFYWLLKHSTGWALGFAKRHWLIFAIILAASGLELFIARGYVYEYVITVRKFFGSFLAAITAVGIFYWLARKHKWRGKLLLILIYLVIGFGIYEIGKPIHHYLAQYYCYKVTDTVELEQLPETAYERILPLNSVFSQARELVQDNVQPDEPHFVRIGDQYRFTMGIEPIPLMPRIFSGVRQVYNIDGTTPAPDWGLQNLINVRFEVGEDLKWGRNAYVAVSRAFGPWRYFNYEPDGVIYLQDDSGKLVQVVPLIRWKGLIFPRPIFGGVQVIEQSPDGLLQSVRRTLVGCGYYVSPAKMKNYPFLNGQNVLSYKVSRYVADSFKFHNGILSPLPGIHNGDIRIADMPEDMNDQPFTIFFRLGQFGGKDTLYHYFSLQPYAEKSQGLSISLFVPADGRGKNFIFSHHKKEPMLGVTAVTSKVIGDHKFFDWTMIRPVEQRPYINKINGKTRLYWLTTIVTLDSKDNKHHIAGSRPDVVLTDAANQCVYWMESADPKTWKTQLEANVTFKPVMGGAPQAEKVEPAVSEKIIVEQ